MGTEAFERHPLLPSELRERCRQARLLRLSKIQGYIEEAQRQTRRSAKRRAGRGHNVSVTRIRKSAAELVADGIQEFADCLLLAQRRVGVHADLLREFTATIINEIRDILNRAALVGAVSLAWGDDAVTKRAIAKCEEILREREAQGDHTEFGIATFHKGSATWPGVVQSWEAFKESNRIMSVGQERIPEEFLRRWIAHQEDEIPEDITEEQIRRVGTELCRHYGPCLMVPVGYNVNPFPEPFMLVRQSKEFWKEREGEFRQHSSGPNCHISALWFSEDNSWSLRSEDPKGSARQASIVFNPIAREAASGLNIPGDRAAEWKWLDGLRVAVDGSGQALYSKRNSDGTRTQGERAWRKISGESTPPGWCIEFVLARGSETKDGSPDMCTEMSRKWEAHSDLIPQVFTASANFCLELRSRVGGAPSKTDVIGTRRGYRAEVREWMKQQGIDNVQEAAKRLHISGSTLKSIMSSRGKRRYGDDCLRQVLSGIKSK